MAIRSTCRNCGMRKKPSQKHMEIECLEAIARYSKPGALKVLAKAIIALQHEVRRIQPQPALAISATDFIEEAEQGGRTFQEPEFDR